MQQMAIGITAVIVLIAAPWAQSGEPLLLQSEAGWFSLQITGLARRERLNRLHGFDLSLATAGDRPAAGALVTIGGQRRYAPSSLPTAPQVLPGPGAGSYRVEGLRFHMAGEWRLVLDIEFEQIRDRAVVDLVVQ
jgi:hypothetical protein